MALIELPIAQLTAMVANVAGGKKDGGSFVPADFQLFQERKDPHGAMPLPAAAALLSLRADRRMPERMLVCWDAVLAVADQTTGKRPKTRALVSDAEDVWIVAPEWEEGGIRGLVYVDGRIGGAVTVRDLDKPLLRFRVKVPGPEGMGWMRAGQLLPLAAT